MLTRWLVRQIKEIFPSEIRMPAKEGGEKVYWNKQICEDAKEDLRREHRCLAILFYLNNSFGKICGGCRQ